MKQYFSVALAVLFCALMPAACTTQTTAVKFMSYNIRNGRGADDVQDLGRIAEVIGRVAPDVVALQEVDSVTGRMNGRFIPEELGRMTGMHARFCRAIDYDGGGYGIGLLTPEDQRASLPIIRQATDTCRKPVLLAGDFNMDDAGKVLGGLGGEFRPLSDTAQLTFPSDRPSIRIDYILGRGLPQSAKIAERTVDYTTVASDHCPLWVSLVW